MSRRLFSIALSIIVSSGIVASYASSYTFAQTQPVVETKEPTETQIEKIQSECSNIKNHLKKLRSNDALMRVNLGQNYETISTRLMANLNVRISTNKLNGAKLVEKSAEFNENIGYFRDNYQIYEKELVKLTEIDCTKKPRDFYIQLERVRYYRSELNFNTTKLAEIGKEYKSSLSEFKDKEIK
jgi:hypothetical protein